MFSAVFFKNVCCWFAFLALCLSGCTNAGLGPSNEVPLLLLADSYRVEMEVSAFQCDIGSDMSEAGQGVAEVTQTGNQVVWRQYSMTQEGAVNRTNPWVLQGRVCERGGVPVVRLRGGRVSRMADGEVFCRAELHLPAADTHCAAAEDICDDPAALELLVDPCSDRLVSAFRGCLLYSEGCAGQNGCRLAVRMSASVLASEAAEGCTPLALPAPPDGCMSECVACGCEPVQ